MPSRHVLLKDAEPPALREGLRRLRAGLGLPGEFTPEVQAEAERVGGAVHVINGNHETMNVAGQYRYVTRGGMHKWVLR